MYAASFKNVSPKLIPGSISRNKRTWTIAIAPVKKTAIDQFDVHVERAEFEKELFAEMRPAIQEAVSSAEQKKDTLSWGSHGIETPLVKCVPLCYACRLVRDDQRLETTKRSNTQLTIQLSASTDKQEAVSTGCTRQPIRNFFVPKTGD